MLDPTHPIAKLLQEDRRYKIDAYAFVFEALNYAHSQLGMGTERQPEAEEEPEENEEDDGTDDVKDKMGICNLLGRAPSQVGD